MRGATLSLLACAASMVVSAVARADAPGLFGPSARSAGVARADLTTADPVDSPRENAALAAAPGFRLRASYGFGAMGLQIDGLNAGVDDVGALSIGAQYGFDLSHDLTLGFAMGFSLPDRYLAKIAFRPASEPQFVLYEAPLERTSADFVVALRYRAFSLGGGVAGALDVGGGGTNFNLGQDARGTYADAALDVSVPYRFAPIVGARADLGRVAVGAAFRGALGVNLALDSVDTIALTGNPLDGTTTVKVRGVSGYDPARVDLGASVEAPLGIVLSFALEYAAWRAAPPPIADVTLDIMLGTTPSLEQARFIEPRFHDTLSPRAGVEFRQPASSGPDAWSWALRTGYTYAPSPVPEQNGFTSYADADRHEIAIGGGYRFGKLAGVEWSGDVAGQLHVLVPRSFDKPDAGLPHPHYEATGHIAYGGLGLEGVWR